MASDHDSMKTISGIIKNYLYLNKIFIRQYSSYLCKIYEKYTHVHINPHVAKVYSRWGYIVEPFDSQGGH